MAGRRRRTGEAARESGTRAVRRPGRPADEREGRRHDPARRRPVAPLLLLAETGESLLAPRRVVAGLVVIRHLEYTRARLAQTSQRLRERVYPETRPRRRAAREPARRPDPRERGAGARVPAGRAGRALRAALGDVLVPRRARRCRTSGRAGASTCSGTPRSEATLWLDGVVAQGLNRHHRGRRARRATPSGGERVSFEVELACNGLFGEAGRRRSSCTAASSAVFDPDAWRLYFDFETLRALEAGEGARPEPGPASCGPELDRFCNDWRADRRDPGARCTSTANGTRAHELSAIGHAHIDTAWLWPLAETLPQVRAHVQRRRRRYMDEYPEYRFACSQAQQYAWIKERNPELWERIGEQVEAGQFVPVGGTWVEPDCNIPSGESLVRQFLHGQRFFEQRVRRPLPRVLEPRRRSATTASCRRSCAWPASRASSRRSSPGTASTSPSTTRSSGRAIDGSEVLAPLPARRHVQRATATVAGAAARRRGTYKDHDHSAHSLLLFGYGDGGGGPTREMLETLRRARDLQGLPRTKMRTSDEFFDALEAEPGERPVVVGELYFEYHRGTYTTQARDEARQPRVRAGAARRRVPRRALAAATIRARSSTGSGSSCS